MITVAVILYNIWVYKLESLNVADVTGVAKYLQWYGRLKIWKHTNCTAL